MLGSGPRRRVCGGSSRQGDRETRGTKLGEARRNINPHWPWPEEDKPALKAALISQMVQEASGRPPGRRRLKQLMRDGDRLIDTDGEMMPSGWRPQCRADCEKVPRPCPYIGCAMHKALVNLDPLPVRKKEGDEEEPRPPEATIVFSSYDNGMSRDDSRRTQDRVGELLTRLARGDYGSGCLLDWVDTNVVREHKETHSFNTVGEQLHISRQTAHADASSALRKIREKLGARGIRDEETFLEEGWREPTDDELSLAEMLEADLTGPGLAQPDIDDDGDSLGGDIESEAADGSVTESWEDVLAEDIGGSGDLMDQAEWVDEAEGYGVAPDMPGAFDEVDAWAV